MKKEAYIRQRNRAVEQAVKLAESRGHIDTFLAKDVYLYLEDTLAYVNGLDEPQKPVVPQFVANEIERYEDMLDMLSGEYFNNSFEEIDDDGLLVWIDENQDTFARAWLDGYEVEKEPQWVVKDDTGYLSYLQFSIPNIYERETSLDKNDAYKFNSKSKAGLIADLVNGTVEEVAE